MPIPGLSAYDDDQLSDHDDRLSSRPMSEPGPTDGNQLNLRSYVSSDNLKLSTSSAKSAVIIRRHIPVKSHPRARLDNVNDVHSPSSTTAPVQTQQASQSFTANVPLPSSIDEPPDELTRIRELLRPPPIPAVQDWGVPKEPAVPCDETTKAKITTFLTLKRSPQNPRHFNDSLMSNRAFRNPHLYAKLVEFVDVDERSTNFPKDIWDPMDVKAEWYADRIAEAQKARSEATSAAQHSSKRARIDFTSSSSTHPQQSSSSSSHTQAQGKHGRHKPYSVQSRGGRGAGEGILGGKTREWNRWG